MRNKEKGITLIALIITIIVLLILVSVTTKLLIGDNNIIETAGWAGYVTEYEEVQEKIELYTAERVLNEYAKENRIASVNEIIPTLELERKAMYPISTKYNINEASASLRRVIKQIEGIRTKDLTDETLVNLYKVDLNKIEKKAEKEYVINIVSGQLYSIEYQKYRGELYHTPRTGVEKDYKEVVAQIDEPGKYEIIVDAGMFVDWETMEISYGRYVDNSVSIKVYTSDDEEEWTEENIEISTKNTIKEIYNILAENKTQYLKIEIDVQEVNGKFAEIDYILVKFYKYKELDVKPTVIPTGVGKIDDTYVVISTTGGTTGGTPTGTVTQVVTIPEDTGEYIIDLGEPIGNPKSTVTVTVGGIDTVYSDKDVKEIRNLPIPPGATVRIVTTVLEGEGVKEVKVLKEEQKTEERTLREIEVLPDKEDIWITEKSKIYMYNSGGSGYWQKCLINDEEVGQTGILTIQEGAKRIRVTYQVSEDGETWSNKFTNIQDANSVQYLKVQVEYQVKSGYTFGNIKNNKIKVVLNDGSWAIEFKDGEELLFRRRVYFANNSSHQGTIELPNYISVKEENGEYKEFKSWLYGDTEYLPGANFTATTDTVLYANYITPTVSVTGSNIEKNGFTLNITTNYTDMMVDKYVYHIDDLKPIEGTKTQKITGLTPNTTYTVYVEAYSKAGKITPSATTPIATLENIPPNDATIILDATEVNINETIHATVTQSDDGSGINITNCKYIINGSETPLGEDATAWGTATAFTTATQIINITKSTRGAYYLHVLSVDNAGNKKETVSDEMFFKGQLTIYNGDYFGASGSSWAWTFPGWTTVGSEGNRLQVRGTASKYTITDNTYDLNKIKTITFRIWCNANGNGANGELTVGISSEKNLTSIVASATTGKVNFFNKGNVTLKLENLNLTGRYYVFAKIQGFDASGYPADVYAGGSATITGE